MAKATSENQTPETNQSEAPQMTVADLLAVISKMQEQHNAQLAEVQRQANEANKAMVDAILESRKPYEDPTKKANEELFRRQEKEQQLRTKANLKFARTHCDHMAGNHGDLPDIYQRTSIAWHQGDVGQTFGICVGCGRVFHQDDPDFGKWRQKKSFCRVDSQAGRRFVADPMKAQKIARLNDDSQPYSELHEQEDAQAVR